MIFNWKGDGVLTITPIDVSVPKQFDKLDKKDREEAVRPYTDPVDQIVVIPGWNEVSDEIWDLCRPHITSKIDSGKIEELAREEEIPVLGEDGKPLLNEEGKPKKEKKFVGVTVSDFKNRQGANFGPSRLVEIIRGCNSIATLTKWLDEDARDEIRTEIKKQIDKLNAPPVVTE